MWGSSPHELCHFEPSDEQSIHLGVETFTVGEAAPTNVVIFDQAFKRLLVNLVYQSQKERSPFPISFPFPVSTPFAFR